MCGGRLSLRFNLAERISATSSTNSSQPTSSVSTANWCVGSIGIVGLFQRGISSSWPPWRLFVTRVLPCGHASEVSRYGEAVRPLAQPIDPHGRFSLSAPALSGHTLLNYRPTCRLGGGFDRR